MGTPRLKTVVATRLNADFIASLIERYPTSAAPLTEEWWSGLISTTPCRCPPPARPLSVEFLHPLLVAGVLGRSSQHRHECGAVFVLESGRFIFHPRSLNTRTSPPPLSLPSPRFVCEMVANCTILTKFDFASWFYQVPIPPFARPSFSFQASRADGGWTRLEMQVLPMGWAASCATADAATRCIAGVPESETWDRTGFADDVTCYVDDVLARTPGAALRFRVAAARAGAILKTDCECSNGIVKYIGILIRVPGGQFRPSAELTNKTRSAIERLCDPASPPPSADEWLRAAGLTVALLERRGTCLAAGQVLFSRLPPRGQGRAAGLAGRRLAGSAAEAAVQLASPGGWRRVVRPSSTCVGASDASLGGWGWVWLTPVPRWGGGRWRSTASINLLELIGVLRAVRRAPPDCRLLLWVDNLCTLHWINRGTSRLRLACNVILAIQSHLWRTGSTLEAAYIPSQDNIADGMSRGSKAPASLHLPPWPGAWNRRVLGWSAPHYDGEGDDARDAEDIDSASRGRDLAADEFDADISQALEQLDELDPGDDIARVAGEE